MKFFSLKTKMILSTLLATAVTVVAQGQSIESDGSFLDPKYSKLNTVSSARSLQERRLEERSFPANSDVISVIQTQTEVKAQGARGTCSIFSATAMAESFLVNEMNQNNQVDLSEEWLQYVLKRTQSFEGSTSPENFSMIQRIGLADEEALPYLGETWESLSSSALAQERCGTIANFGAQKSCLLGHFNPQLFVLPIAELLNRESKFYAPEIAQSRKQARISQEKYFLSELIQQSTLQDEVTIKNTLASGVPLTLDIDFYYGTWNHRKAPEFGMQRNMDHWYKGIVGYPARGSVDETRSREEPAGHSILIVGYDDNFEVMVPTLMANGQTKNIRYKGVYYFKNSWGQENFGKDFMIDGKRFPGYGMITQKHAHDHGEFFGFYNPSQRPN